MVIKASTYYLLCHLRTPSRLLFFSTFIFSFCPAFPIRFFSVLFSHLVAGESRLYLATSCLPLLPTYSCIDTHMCYNSATSSS